MKFFSMNEFTNELKKRQDIIKEIIKDEPNYVIAKEIVRERINKGLSQQELAQKTKLTQTQISRLENAQIGNLQTITKVLDALDLKISIVSKNKPRHARCYIVRIPKEKRHHKNI